MKPTAKQQAEALIHKASVMSRSFDQLYEKAEVASVEARQHAEAARDARDEARESRDRAEVFNNCCETFMLKAADSASEAKNHKDFIYRMYKFDFWWKLAIMSLVIYDIFVRLTT